jgi:hypothetical protein
MKCNVLISVLIVLVSLVSFGLAVSILPDQPSKDSDDKTWKPPAAQWSKAPGLNAQKYEMRVWQEKTKKESSHWFASYPDRADGWFIDWDAERKPFDLIVIHHSATAPNITAESISASIKERLYIPRYRSEDRDPYVRGLPVHSGHVINGKETFIPYHHLVYPDGKITTELRALQGRGNVTWYVDQVGWHAGNWDVNCRSIAICLTGDFTGEEPPEKQVKATLKLIDYYRTYNGKLDVKPHGHFKNTACPGKAWDAIKRALS